MKKYNLLIFHTRKDGGATLETIVFNCPKAANAAKAEIVEINRGQNVGGYILILPDTHTVDSIFLELLKANPFGNVSELMDKAKEAFTALHIL